MKKKSNVILAGSLFFLFLKLVEKTICPRRKYSNPRFQVLEVSIERIKNDWFIPKDNGKKLRHIFMSYDFHQVSNKRGTFDYNFDMTCYQQYVDKDQTELSFVPLCGDLEVARYSHYDGFHELVMGSMFISIEAFKKLIEEIEKIYKIKTVRFYPYAPPVSGKKSVTSLVGFLATEIGKHDLEKVKLTSVPGVLNIGHIKVHPDPDGNLLVEANPCPPHDIDDQITLEI